MARRGLQRRGLREKTHPAEKPAPSTAIRISASEVWILQSRRRTSTSRAFCNTKVTTSAIPRIMSQCLRRNRFIEGSLSAASRLIRAVRSPRSVDCSLSGQVAEPDRTNALIVIASALFEACRARHGASERYRRRSQESTSPRTKISIM